MRQSVITDVPNLRKLPPWVKLVYRLMQLKVILRGGRVTWEKYDPQGNLVEKGDFTR